MLHFEEAQKKCYFSMISLLFVLFYEIHFQWHGYYYFCFMKGHIYNKIISHPDNEPFFEIQNKVYY